MTSVAGNRFVPAATRWRAAIPRIRGIRVNGDIAAVALLLMLVAVAAWDRIAHDMWLSRVDILQQQLPYFTFLGEQLAAGNIPGWSPHQLSGQPFLADPLSGWMQLPVMALFVALDPVVAFKSLVAFNLGLATIATYAYARVLGMGIPAGIVAAIGMGFGTLIHFNTYCCNIMGNFAPWIPVALLGVELAVRAQRWLPRAAALGLAGLGVSQLLAAWLGQGTFYAVFLVGGYVLYRTVLSPPRRADGWSGGQRVVTLLAIGGGVVVAGFGLAAAGLLPRLDISRYSTLSGGDYEALGVRTNAGLALSQLLDMVLDVEFVARRVYIGTCLLVLALLAPVFARRTLAVPFFATVTVVGYLLILNWTPIHELFFLIPRFETLHTHSDYRIIGALLLGPPMLAGATVDAMRRVRVRWPVVAIALAPGLFYACVGLFLASSDRALPIYVWAVVILSTLLLGAFLLLRLDRDWRLLRPVRPLSGLVLAAIIGLLIADPAGNDIYETVSGNSAPFYLAEHLRTDQLRDGTVATHTACADPGGAGEFLQQRAAAQNAPFRYFGYNAVNLRTAERNTDETISYHGAQAFDSIQALLVGTRATCLGIFDLQGYSPVQVERYWEFLQAVNGERLNYHDAVVLTSGSDSPLLSLLNPAYIITPRTITDERPDLQQVAATMPQVFSNNRVRVFENTRAFPHAWIVHDVQAAPKDQVLDILTSGTINPRQTAIIEGDPPVFSAPAVGGAAGSVTFAAYEPDRMAMRVETSGDGLLVLSEVYSPGWKAYVDGDQVPISPTNYVLRGVAVPAGSHTVELRYEPDSLRIGLWISAITAIALVGVAVAAAWQALRARRAALQPASHGRQRLDVPADDFGWARRIEAAMQPQVLRERGAANLQPRFWGAAWRERHAAGTLLVWRRDIPAVLALGMLAFLYAWIRVGLRPDYFRGDILTQFLPFYRTVAERFASGDLPGWNPAMFSGMPLAGDPITGWGYLPVLVSFAIFAPLTAYKVHVIVHVVGAGLATYFFARSLRMGPLGAFAAGLSFVLGPHYQYAQCCTARMQLGPWIPLGLLAVEMAVRGRTALVRWIWWGVAGVSIGQMIAGYFGKGMYYGVMVVGGYLAYRTLIAPPGGAPIRRRLVDLALHGVGIFGFGAGFAAWVLLPRLDFLDRSNLAGGTYEAIAPGAVDPPAWTVAQALGTILSPDRPSYYLGGATVALAIAGVVLGGRRYAVPYFALMSFCVLALTLTTTPLHNLFYLLPRFQVIHEHEPQRILVVLNIGPAILAGAAVSAVQQRVARPRHLFRAAVAVPLTALLFIILAERGGRSLGGSVLLASIVTGILLAGCAAAPWLSPRKIWSTWATTGMAAVLVLFLAANLDGGRLSDGYADGFGSQGVNDLTYAYADDSGAGGAGGFLRQRQAEGEYFRYYGYNPRYLSGEEDFLVNNYRSQWSKELSAELLVNNRALSVGLQDIQGYDPVYYLDYLRFMDTVNGQPQEYHENNVLPSGIDSPLLRLLNIRYVVVPDVDPEPGTDLAMLNESYREVFRNGHTRVLEIPDALPRAWVVHDVRQEQEGSILPLITDGGIDPLQTALMSDPAPALEPLPPGGVDEVAITDYQPDQVTMTATLGSVGLLVLSEVYDPGWDVLIDGEQADLLKVDGLLRAVVVPAGTHEVEFRYAPAVLRSGTALTGATLGVFLLGAVGLRLRGPLGGRVPARRRQRSTAPRPT